MIYKVPHLFLVSARYYTMTEKANRRLNVIWCMQHKKVLVCFVVAFFCFFCKDFRIFSFFSVDFKFRGLCLL